MQGKITATKEVMINEQLDEASEVLLALGYKNTEVDKVIAKLAHEKMDTNGYVKKALSMLVK